MTFENISCRRSTCRSAEVDAVFANAVFAVHVAPSTNGWLFAFVMAVFTMVRPASTAVHVDVQQA